MNSALLQRFREPFAIVIALGIACLAGKEVANGNHKIVFLFIAAVGLAIAWSLSMETLLCIGIATYFLGGNFNFLPLGLRASEMVGMLITLKFFLDFVVMKKQTLRPLRQSDFILLLPMVLVLFYHAAKDKMGMRIFNAPVWGGREYISVILGLALFIITSVIPLKAERFRFLPLYILIPMFFDLGISLVTAFIPSLVFPIYQFYSNVSLAGFEMYDKNQRIGTLGSAGIILVLLCISYTRLTNLWKPDRWIIFVFIFAGLVGCIAGGYRSTVLNAGLLLIAAALRDFKWRAIVPIMLAGAMLFFLPIVHDHITPLPKQVQRALTFLPGNWDYAVVQDSKGSDDFRITMWTRWFKELFPGQELLGNGFGVPSEDLIRDINQMSFDPQTHFESLLGSRQLHNGLLSTIDCLGILGGIPLILWVLKVLWENIRVCMRYSKPAYPGNFWLCSFYIVMWATSYWIGALKVSGFLPQMFLFTAVSRLLYEKRTASAPNPGAVDESIEVLTHPPNVIMPVRL